MLDVEGVRELRRYLESLLGEDWVEGEVAKQDSWSANNSDPYLQITLGHKPPAGNQIIALACAARLWERDPKGWFGGIPTAVKRMATAATTLAVAELHAGR